MWIKQSFAISRVSLRLDIRAGYHATDHRYCKFLTHLQNFDADGMGAGNYQLPQIITLFVESRVTPQFLQACPYAIISFL